VRELARADVGESQWQPCAELAAAAAKGSRAGGVGTLKILRSKRNDGKKTFAGGTERRRRSNQLRHDTLSGSAQQ